MKDSFSQTEEDKSSMATAADRLNVAELAMCHAAMDGDCIWKECPQLRDGEPKKSGRHCPLDNREDEEMRETRAAGQLSALRAILERRANEFINARYAAKGQTTGESEIAGISFNGLCGMLVQFGEDLLTEVPQREAVAAPKPAPACEAPPALTADEFRSCVWTFDNGFINIEVTLQRLNNFLRKRALAASVPPPRS